MKEEFVRSNKDLMKVLQSAQKHERELMVATLRKAASSTCESTIVGFLYWQNTQPSGER
jgi:hypothetical protein